MSPGPSSQPAPEDESTDMETEIPSPAATINTVRVTTEEKHRELLNMLLIPKRPALNHAVNSWRNKIPKEWTVASLASSSFALVMSRLVTIPPFLPTSCLQPVENALY